MQQREQIYEQRRQNLDEYKKSRMLKVSSGVESPQKIIDSALAAEYPHRADNTRYQLGRMLVLQPEDTKIKINGKEFKVNELDAAIADSIEILNSSTSSKEEYHDWISYGHKVISDMTTNGVTSDELKERNYLLSDLDQREVELMTCLGLYQRGIDDPQIKAKYDALYAKLQKLREIKSSIKNSTKEVADEVEKQPEPEPVEPSKTEKHLMYAAMETLSIYDRLTKEEKQNLNMYHGDDFNNINFHNHLRNYYLFNSDVRFNRKNAEEIEKYETAPTERVLLDRYSSKNQVAEHIAMLSGIKSKYVNKGIIKSDDETRYRGAFDEDRFKKILALKLRKNQNN